VKVVASIWLLICCISCNTAEEEDAINVSTIDSNTVNQADTAPPILYLDNTKLDSFPMAMDSAGPLIQADDTSYRKPGE
jgi:hypothetical protein